MTKDRSSGPSGKLQPSRPRSADKNPSGQWIRGAFALEPTEQAGVLVARVLEEHILDRLQLAGLIAPIQREAGLRFARDYREAGMKTRLAASYNPTRSAFSVYGGWDERTDEEERAYRRWRDAMKFLRGRLGDVLVSVVCYDETPDGNTVRILRCGLKVLVETYGLRSGLTKE